MKKSLAFMGLVAFSLLLSYTTIAQQYKLRQITTTDYAKLENTIYVKGMRQRVETGAVMGMGGNFITIMQCDLKRTITLDTVKKLYFIDPFNTGKEETAIQPAKEPSEQEKNARKGGTITVWYNVHDTGERKERFGFTARHIWSDQKMKPSVDACSMKDSMMMYTDGWYIDLPEFNCPRQHESYSGGYRSQEACNDKMIIHESGKAKIGFPLSETITMIFGTHKMVTKIETIDLSTAKLDSSLFTIPPGYKEAKNREELMASINIGEIMDKAGKEEEAKQPAMQAKEAKMPGALRIGVYAPTGNEDIEANIVRAEIISFMTTTDIEAITIKDEEEAHRYQCDYTLTTNYNNIKSSAKVTNVLKAIKRADPNAIMTYTVQGNMTLTNMKDGSVKNQQTLDSKYDGRINEIAGKAAEEGWKEMKKVLRM